MDRKESIGSHRSSLYRMFVLEEAPCAAIYAAKREERARFWPGRGAGPSRLGVVRGNGSEAMLKSATQPSRPKMPAEGLIVVPSDFDAEQTMNRLEAEVRARGMTVFARIDHSAGARSVVRPPRPAELLIFGNPRDSALLMQADQQIGIDLPLRVLVYLDADGNAWIAYYSPTWLAERHGLPAQMTPSVSALTAILEAVAAKVARLPSRT